MKLFSVFIIVVTLIIVTACAKDVGLNPDLVIKSVNICDSVTFDKNIKPIIINKCVSCHNSTGGPGNGDFQTDTYTGIKQKVDNGAFKNRVVILHDMPQGGPPLPQNEIDLINCWLDAGAPNN